MKGKQDVVDTEGEKEESTAKTDLTKGD